MKRVLSILFIAAALSASAQTKPKTRYFIVSYTASRGISGITRVYMDCFFAIAYFQKYMKDQYQVENAIPTCIMEVTKSDYQEYSNEPSK